MASLPTSPLKGVSLLFLKVDDVYPPSNERQIINGLEIIYAIENVTGRGTIEGAQKIGKLFRIYIKSVSARDKLCTEGFTFRDRQVSLYSHNPFTVREQAQTVKIIIGGVPLSVAHDEFEKALIDLKVEMVSDIKFENYRDNDGKWTAYKTGRRFVYCKKPELNLMPFTKIGLWSASIFYRGQIRPTKSDQPVHTSSLAGNAVSHDQLCSSDTNTPATGSVDTTVGEASDPVAFSDPGLADESVNTNNNRPEPVEGKLSNVVDKSLSDYWPQDVDSNNTGSADKQKSGGRSRAINRVSQNRLTDFVRDRRHRSMSVKRKNTVSGRTPSPPSKNNRHFKNTQKSPTLFSNNKPTDWFNCVGSAKTDPR